MAIIIIVIIVIILILLILSAIEYNNIKEEKLICEKAIERIDIILKDKKENIDEIIKTMKNKKINKLQKIDESMNTFDVEEILFNYRWELNKISTDDYLESEKLTNIMKKIVLDDESIDGLKDFYNNKANKYNNLYHKYILISKIFKFHQKELFKNRKIDEYDILKN